MRDSTKSKAERLRSAAVVKLKYQMITGKLDSGFQVIFGGVLEDLELTAEEVEAYIEQNREALTEICLAK